ncbi:MAG: type II toxin-antitoxin system RelE/ParE family toxin [Desulfovibrionaceae bacterium]|jgi:phage-related protein|nr:type II toxin-antitoxin system RelE/ParE family toxin [Desulfovibrionaceae bacterium]
MDQSVLTVVFFRTATGSEPVRDWLRDLTVEDRKAIGTDIKTVECGWPLGMPLVRKMEPGLWEVRSDVADGIARVLFTTRDGQMVLLHGFIKKSRQTPENELKTARNRLKKLKENAS